MIGSFFLKGIKRSKKSTESDYLFVGLGNPKEKYENTRHNIGFMVIDKIADNFQFPKFDIRSNFNAQIAKGTIENKNIFLVKPMTFMNLSGKSVSKIARFYKIISEKIIIIHDDIDIPLGKIKIVKNRGSGGHKGIESIIKETGNRNFIRIRIGISPLQKPKNAETFVLQKFKKEENFLVNDISKETIKAIEMLLKEGIEKSASLFNK